MISASSILIDNTSLRPPLSAPAHDVPPEIIEEYFETWVEGQDDSPQEADSPGGSSAPSVKSPAQSPKEEDEPSTSGAAIAEAAAKVAKVETFGVPSAAAAAAEPAKPTALVLPQPQVSISLTAKACVFLTDSLLGSDSTDSLSLVDQC